MSSPSRQASTPIRGGFLLLSLWQTRPTERPVSPCESCEALQLESFIPLTLRLRASPRNSFTSSRPSNSQGFPGGKGSDIFTGGAEMIFTLVTGQNGNLLPYGWTTVPRLPVVFAALNSTPLSSSTSRRAVKCGHFWTQGVKRFWVLFGGAYLQIICRVVREIEEDRLASERMQPRQNSFRESM